MSLPKILAVAGLALAAHAAANAANTGAATPAAPTTGGTLVVVPATGEVRAPNDQAIVTFMVEEHDKDKVAAAARVNRKMKEGTEIVRRLDPRAELKTQGYFTYPVYPEPPVEPLPAGHAPVKPVPVGWRVGQYLEVKTVNLAELPKTAAAAQKVLSINGIQFGLSPATEKMLDDRRIQETYRKLNERIVSIARAMGRQPTDAVIDTVDFEGSGNYVGSEAKAAAAPMRGVFARGGNMDDQMPEPSFEPGETVLEMRVVGKVRFK